MDKRIIIAIVGAVILIGGGGYYLTQKNAEPASTNQSEATKANGSSSESSSAKGSISSFLGSSESKECNYSSNAGGTQVTGTMYFANGQMRNNYTSTKDDKAQNGSMIVTTGAQYIWDNDSKKGMKFAFDPDTPTSNTSSGSASQSVDVNQEYDFTCKNWSVDNSYFSPPKDVTIQDLSKLQQQLPTSR